MSKAKRTVGIIAVGAVAFVAGRFGFPPAAPLVAAQETQEKAEAPAGPTDAPGAHHAYLNTLIGDWTGEVKIWWEPGSEPMVSKGQVVRKWILDGRFVREDWESEAPMGETFRGLGYLGYNNSDGVYESIWMDNMTSTGIVMDRGVYDAEKQILHMSGLHRDGESGKMVHTRGELDLSNPDRHMYIGWVRGNDGKEWKSFEGVMTRK